MSPVVTLKRLAGFDAILIDDIGYVQQSREEMEGGGQYDRDASIDVQWTTGDWNCDGVFDSSDLVAALQVGHYTQT